MGGSVTLYLPFVFAASFSGHPPIVTVPLIASSDIQGFG